MPSTALAGRWPRFAASTWGQHMSILSMFYRWALAEGHAQAEPFTYKTARALFAGTSRQVRVNLAVRRRPKPHVTIKYLEPDFTELFVRGLRGLAPDGTADSRYWGREVARNAAVGELALATGLRLQEFSYLLAFEIPPLPPAPTAVPIPFAAPAGVTKGRKFRTTWISYQALAAVHHYLELDRAATVDGAAWRPPARWGEPLQVSEPDSRGGRINGVRRAWDALTPPERRRLVAPGGGSCLLAVKAGGGPFTAWATVFSRTADRIRARFEPRFPHVHPHRLRHTFAMRTLEYLVSGHYRQAAKLITATDADAALALYLSKADPLLVLRDLLGHSSVLGLPRACSPMLAIAPTRLSGKPTPSSPATSTTTSRTTSRTRGSDAGGVSGGAVGHRVRVQRRQPRGIPPGRPARAAVGLGPAGRPGRADPPARQRGRRRQRPALRPRDPQHGPGTGRAGLRRRRWPVEQGEAHGVLDGRLRWAGGLHPPGAARLRSGHRRDGTRGSGAGAGGRPSLQPPALPSGAAALPRSRVGAADPDVPVDHQRRLRRPPSRPGRRRTRPGSPLGRLVAAEPALAACPLRTAEHPSPRAAAGLLDADRPRAGRVLPGQRRAGRGRDDHRRDRP